MDRPNTTATAEERLDAMEFFVGQLLIALEAESESQRARLARLESVIDAMLPGTLARLTAQEAADGEDTPFTVESFGRWMQICIGRMRAHGSASARQMVAIGELTTRILDEADGPTAAQEPAIGRDALAALAKAKRPPSPG